MLTILFLDLCPLITVIAVLGLSKYSLNSLSTAWLALFSLATALTQSKNSESLIFSILSSFEFGLTLTDRRITKVFQSQHGPWLPRYDAPGTS
jgi:hypothetical protein